MAGKRTVLWKIVKIFVFSTVLFCLWYLQVISHLTSGYTTKKDDKVQNHLKEAADEKSLWESGWESWKEEQERRKEGMKAACRGIPREDQLENLLFNRKGLSNLLVDDRHKAIYCYIPKVACTNWKRIWMILTGMADTTEAFSISPKGLHGRARKMSLNYGNPLESELREKLRTYTKMIVVRHPFQRLLSAYRDKIDPITGDRPFQKQVLKYVRSLRKNATFTNLQWGDFVDFVIHGGGRHGNEHWRLYESLCHPCAIHYDVIIHFESLQEDSERYLRSIKAPWDLHFPGSSSKAKLTDAAFLEQYMSRLTHKQVIALYETYQRDLQLFQYN